jgi:putative ABC transport system permease protein
LTSTAAGFWREEQAELTDAAAYGRFVNRTIEINDNRSVVAGVCDVSANFQTLPIIYTTYSRAKEIVPPERKLMSFVLVKVDSAAALHEVSQRIAERTSHSTKALTTKQFFWDTIYYYVTRTGIPLNFAMTVGLGFLVGTAVAG